MNPNKLPILIAVVLIAFAVYSSIFTVNERQYAIKFRLGEIVKTDYKPGLHWKIPFINNIRKFDKRILTLDEEAFKQSISSLGNTISGRTKSC